MKKYIASCWPFGWFALYRILSLLLLSLWLAACASQWTASVSQPSLPTHSQSWARVEIVKPTYTPAPTLALISTLIPIDTSIEIQNPTPVPPEQISAEIVPDTPTPEYVTEYPSTQQQSAPASPIYGGSKYILISISEQHLYAYEGDTLVFSFVSSTGMNNATRVGTFSVLDKIPSAYGATWNIWMPNWLGIYYAGSLENGIHALPILPNGAQLWAGFLGQPISYGCIVLGVNESQLLYDWADIGTPVEIRW